MNESLVMENVNTALDDFMRIKGVRSAIFALESRDGTMSQIEAAGDKDSDGNPMSQDTPYWIASVTKIYIAAVILKLYESGKISLDDKITSFFPKETLQGVHVIDGVDYCENLKIRHLLTHSSGIPDYLEIKDEKGKTLIDQVLEGEDMSWSIGEIMDIIRRKNKPHFPPQDPGGKKTKIRYSDTNYQMLVSIIETITNKPIEDVFRDMIFDPLNLNDTFLPGQRPQKDVADVWIGNVLFNDKPKAMRSFGDLYSTGKDQINFMRYLIEGKLFEKKKTLDLMKGNWNTFGFSPSPISPGWPIQYSMGMMRFKVPFIVSPFKKVPEVIGHSGAVGSWLFYCEKADVILAGSVNQVTAAATPFKVLPKLLKSL